MNERIRWAAYHWGRTLKWKTYRSFRPWIFGRYSCLGRDVLDRLALNTPVLNIQKGRVDLLCALADDSIKRPRTGQVARFIQRRDILPLISQQETRDWWRGPPPGMLIMDSFAELTDQLFVHRRNGWGFCAHYSDLRHGEGFEDFFESRGLLEEETFEQGYRQFFSLVRSCFSRVPIFFLHFPTILDSRDKFQHRFAQIRFALENLVEEFSPLFSLTVDPGIVDWPTPDLSVGDTRFPYHFNSRTYDAFAEQMAATGYFQLR